MGQRVMITGISRHLAGKLAQRLEADPLVEYIVEVGLNEPESISSGPSSSAPTSGTR